jgi:superfamily II DNA or RNA helicase
LDDFEPGLYEALVTEALRSRIEGARAAGWLVEWKEIDDQTLAAMLARHIHDQSLERLDAIPAATTDRKGQQVRLANKVLAILADHPDEGGLGRLVDPAARVLLGVDRPETAAVARHRPGIPLTSSALLVNAHRDLQIGTQVALEILSADRIDLLCAFVRWAGIRLIRTELEQFLLSGHEMRVIASVYTGSTEKRAIDDLVGLGAKVKISYDTAQTRLHAKAWLFDRASRFDTAYVGSSNLTQSALVDGLEWNVRLTSTDNREIVEHIRRTFDQYWNDPEFESYDPRIDGQRLEDALAIQASIAPLPVRTAPVPERPTPKPFQVPVLVALQAERLRGHNKNLVVAPTGTGKTWISAFDYARLRAAGYERLLFVAHRDEILQQSQGVYRAVVGDQTFGERNAGSERPTKWAHVFASIQSLHRVVATLEPDQFDVLIVDEFHHAEADTYRNLLERLKPRILLGLTATPERADGNDILHWFDDRIAYEMRLWEALDRGLLCPFHYFGIGDGTDLRRVRFERGRYVTSDLEEVLTGDHVRARRILDATNQWVVDPAQMRALGFCAGVAHARFMADQFTEAGLPSVALDGSTDAITRREAVARLRKGEIRAIFTVDIFNEGVDIPEVDTLLLLRPTESATVFLQQLGRGLRWSQASGKSVLTVLDFIGQAHTDYRFDIRYRALIGGTRTQIARSIEHGFPLMPPGCAIRLDEIAQEIVLENLKAAIKNRRQALIEDLRSLPRDTTLSTFLGSSSFDLLDIYARPGPTSTFTAARRSAGHVREPAGQDETEYGKAVGRLLHVNDEERFGQWREWLGRVEPPELAPMNTREGRLQLMLFAGLGERGRPLAEMESAFAVLWSRRSIRFELIELLEVLRSRGFPPTEPIDPYGILPIHSHASYTRYEVLAAYGAVQNGRLREAREGVMWNEEHRSDLLFVTLDKTSEDFSPTTRYNDYPISPTRFHWESQSTTSATSPVGQRYINHVVRGSNVLLFVRAVNEDDRGESNPFVCLGPARYVSHQSSRPIQIIWELDRPMPPDIYDYAKVAAG